MAQNAIGSAGFAESPISSAFAMVDNTPCSPGRAIQISTATSATVILTMADNTTIPVTAATGDNIYPYAVRMFHVTAGAATAYCLS